MVEIQVDSLLKTAIFRLQQKRLHLQKQSHLQAYFHQTQLAEDRYPPVQDHADTSLTSPSFSRTPQTLSPLLEPGTPYPETHSMSSDCETMEAQQGGCVLVKWSSSLPSQTHWGWISDKDKNKKKKRRAREEQQNFMDNKILCLFLILMKTHTPHCYPIPRVWTMRYFKSEWYFFARLAWKAQERHVIAKIQICVSIKSNMFSQKRPF